MRSLSFTVEDHEDGRQLKHVVASHLHLSAHLFSRIKFQNGVLVDGIPTHAGQRVSAGKTVTLLLPEDGPARRTAQDHPLNIAYEDEDLLIINKPAPLPCQASVHQGTDTLENYVAAYLGDASAFVYRPVNRLDKGTSGLMTIAKNIYAQQRLQKQLHTPDFVREYLAVVEGHLSSPAGIIDLPIGKVDITGVKRCIAPSGKQAVTHYEILQTTASRSLVALRLETGRTHQIRVHLQAMGCPVTGDFLYGQETDELPGRFALHAFRLRCIHPVTEKLLSLEAPLPPELKQLLQK